MNKLFFPKSIAIVGVSREERKVGYLVAKNLIDQGYEGEIYFINNKFEGEILGKKVYKSLDEIGKSIDLVALAIPAAVAVSYLDEMNKANVRRSVIYAAGFKETNEKGAKLEQELIDKAKKYNINFLGPNCLGFVNTKDKINLTFLKTVCPAGDIGFVSQSGALGSMLVDYFSSHINLGFSHLISCGNKSQLDESDLMEFLEKDEETKVIALYLESVADGEKFKKVLSKVTKIKPVVVLKSGTTTEGSKAALSHTGGMVGDDDIFTAVLKQYGAIRAKNLSEFIEILKVYSFQRIPTSRSVLVLSNAGGAGVLLTDELIKNNLKLQTISQAVKKDIETVSPKITIRNPIDLLGDASAFAYQGVISSTIKEKDIGSIIVLLTPQANTEIEKTAEVIVQAQKNFDRPIFPVFMGKKTVNKAKLFLEKHKTPGFSTFDLLPSVIDKILTREEKIIQKNETHLGLVKLSYLANEQLINKKLNQFKEKQILDVSESLELLKLIDVPVANTCHCESRELGTKQSRYGDCHVPRLWRGPRNDIGYPVVIKIVSDKVNHKTDVGGVITGIDNKEELTIAAQKIKKIDPSAGFLIQEMIKGQEMFIGAKRDATFGLVMVIGLGGIYTELLKDISYRLFPFSYEDFLTMVGETKLTKLFDGFRGSAPIDKKKIYDIVVRIGYLVERFDQIKEIDLNPLIFSANKIAAVDCRIVLS